MKLDNFKLSKVSLVIVVFVVGYFIFGTGKRLITASLYRDEWSQYDSREYSQAETFPDGFRFDYPANWEVTSYENGATKNGRELRISMRAPNYIFSPSTYQQIWWRRVDDQWTLEDTKEWYIDDVAFGVNNTELEQKQDSFRNIEIGKGNYPALIQSFTQFEGENPLRQVVLLSVGDEAFVFSFHSENYDEDISATFERMINSLEIYR